MIENAKNADIQAVTRGRKKLKNDATYQAASKDIQNKMEGDMKVAILLKRMFQLIYSDFEYHAYYL
jgi:hypothetical protein